MNAIKDTWRQLVRRRLWPVAVLLVGAAVAVPMVLAKSPETMPPAPVPKLEADDTATTFVSVASDSEDKSESATHRRVLGVQKDPFEPKALPKKKKKKAKQASSETEDTAKAPETSDTPPSDAPAAPAPPVIPTPTPTPAPTYPLNSIKVRFGKVEETSGELEAKTVERLSVLPDDEHPVLVYKGVQDGGKVALFELTGTIVAEGDGECRPTPEDCQVLELRAGETEFITVSETGEETDGQYQLDLVKIHSEAGRDSKK